MPPNIILIRHAQALHNINENYEIPDPDLSDTGYQQCKDLRSSLMTLVGIERDVRIIVSPMRRTIQTALASLDWMIEKGVPVEADALWQENSAKPCDTGSAIVDLVSEFPTVDFSSMDPVYPDKTSPAGARYSHTKNAILARAASAVGSLYTRPEKLVIVVSHSAFLRLGVTGYWFFNGDYRIFDFDQHSPLPELKQRNSTLNGGLGRSFSEPVEIGTGLPEPELLSSSC